jgi:glycine hydroxymethyltransferase
MTLMSEAETPRTEQGRREWLPEVARRRETEILEGAKGRPPRWFEDRIETLVFRNRAIHEDECVNLNPATNAMDPMAENLMAAGLGTRAALGYPGLKYEMGVEALEEIEVLAEAVACRVFSARYVELRVGSGTLANAYAYLATCKPGDRVISPPASIAGHINHHTEGLAGLLGLEVHEAPVDTEHYTVDIDAVASLADRIRPKLITVGGSLNLLPHPVKEIRAIADQVGAKVLFDAAHVCGLVAGGAWPNPLAEGADIMTMSTSKSLGGPPSGLVFTNDSSLAQRMDAIAYPGLTAHFEPSKTAALAISLLDWLDYGSAYATEMISTACALTDALDSKDIPLFLTSEGPTSSHQFAIQAARWGGGQATALRLRQANILTSPIGLPDGEELSGLRVGTPEIVRWGMTAPDMGQLADLLARALDGVPEDIAADVTGFRRQFRDLQFIRRQQPKVGLI